MNEVIQKLYNKSWSKVDPTNPQVTFMNAFAEAIVRECANLHDLNSGYYDENNEWCAYYEVILKHFGVEE